MNGRRRRGGAARQRLTQALSLALAMVALAATVRSARGAMAQLRTQELSLARVRAMQRAQKMVSSGHGDLSARMGDVDRLLSSIKCSFGGQEFDCALDTGSTNTWIASVECTRSECASHALYDPARSSTHEALEEHKTLTVKFGTGQIKGHLDRETLVLGGEGGIVIPEQPFLRVVDQKGRVFQSAAYSGLIGLGFREMAYEQHEPVMDAVFRRNLTNKPQFYFFFGREKNQFFVLGEPPEFAQQHIGPQQVVPVIDKWYWTVSLDDVLLGGVSLLANGVRAKACPHGKCRIAFDSGCTLNTMPTPVYHAIVHAHRTRCAKAAALAETSGGATAEPAPRLTYVIGGVHYDFDPDDFHSSVDNDGEADNSNVGDNDDNDGCAALLLQPLDVPNKHGPLFIAGQTFLRRYLTVFQRTPHGGAQLSISKANRDFKPPASLRAAVALQLAASRP